MRFSCSDNVSVGTSKHLAVACVGGSHKLGLSRLHCINNVHDEDDSLSEMF
jgi:hypothetical protein